MTTARRVSLVALAILLAAPAAVLADSGLAKDADDTPGRLDVHQIRHGHGARGSMIRHRIDMYGQWRDRILRKKGPGHLHILFSTRGSNCAEKRVTIKRKNGELQAFIQEYKPAGCGPNDDVFEIGFPERLDADIERKRGRAIVVTFDKHELRKRIQRYTWSVETVIESDKCGDEGGRRHDFAPDRGEGIRGILEHDLT